MDEEFELLRQYLKWRIDILYVTSLEFKIKNYSKTGFIEYGTPPNQLPNFETWKNLNTIKYTKENEKFKFFITDVGCSFSIGFAQYIAEEHYRLVNVIGEIHYWGNEESYKTSEQLLEDYKNIN